MSLGCLDSVPKNSAPPSGQQQAPNAQALNQQGSKPNKFTPTSRAVLLVTMFRVTSWKIFTKPTVLHDAILGETCIAFAVSRNSFIVQHRLHLGHGIFLMSCVWTHGIDCGKSIDNFPTSYLFLPAFKSYFEMHKEIENIRILKHLNISSSIQIAVEIILQFSSLKLNGWPSILELLISTFCPLVSTRIFILRGRSIRDKKVHFLHFSDFRIIQPCSYCFSLDEKWRILLFVRGQCEL